MGKGSASKKTSGYSIIIQESQSHSAVQMQCWLCNNWLEVFLLSILCTWPFCQADHWIKYIKREKVLLATLCWWKKSLRAGNKLQGESLTFLVLHLYFTGNSTSCCFYKQPTLIALSATQNGTAHSKAAHVVEKLAQQACSKRFLLSKSILKSSLLAARLLLG